MYLNVPKVDGPKAGQQGPVWYFGLHRLCCFVCKCNRIAHLTGTHQIDNEGLVCPGVKCEHCGFEGFIKLQDWSAGYKELYFPLPEDLCRV